MDYEQIKQKYKDYIVMQKQGIFYIVYGLDAYIISYIFDYQVKLNKVGFPDIDKVSDKLNKLKNNVPDEEILNKIESII